MTRNDLPLGFSFALAQNPQAMKKFSNLPDLKQREVLQRASLVSSKAEMESLIHSLSISGCSKKRSLTALTPLV